MTSVEQRRDLGKDPSLGDPREATDDDRDSHEPTRFSELGVRDREARNRAYWPAPSAHLM